MIKIILRFMRMFDIQSIGRILLLLSSLGFYSEALYFGYQASKIADPSLINSYLIFSVFYFISGGILSWISKNYLFFNYQHILYEKAQSINLNKEGTDTLKAFDLLMKNNGFASFFHKINFTGLSLGTIISAILILLIAGGFKKYEILNSEQFDKIIYLVNILIGAFITSFQYKSEQKEPDEINKK